MNGYSDSIQRFLVNNDPISPQSLDSPPWARGSGVSSNLDSRVLRDIIQPQATERSAVLFHQFPPGIVERYVRLVQTYMIEAVLVDKEHS